MMINRQVMICNRNQNVLIVRCTWSSFFSLSYAWLPMALHQYIQILFNKYLIWSASHHSSLISYLICVYYCNIHQTTHQIEFCKKEYHLFLTSLLSRSLSILIRVLSIWNLSCTRSTTALLLRAVKFWENLWLFFQLCFTFILSK